MPGNALVCESAQRTERIPWCKLFLVVVHLSVPPASTFFGKFGKGAQLFLGRAMQALAKQSGDRRFAFDSYRRFVQMYSGGQCHRHVHATAASV